MFFRTSANDTDPDNFFLRCQSSILSIGIYSFYTLICVFCLLPISILILYMGFQKWLRRRRTSAGKTCIHADCLTYHSALNQVNCVAAAVFYTVGAYSKSTSLSMLGVYTFSIGVTNEPFFEMLTCVDLYLAVVYPIQYTLHRDNCGVTVRNICIAMVWLSGFGWLGLTIETMPNFATFPLSIVTAIFLGVITFCAVSVLSALRRSGPGEVRGRKRSVDQRKLRALQIMMSITGVLLLRNISYMLVFGLDYAIEEWVFCWLVDLVVLFTIPSSLVLPLLFLHREGKLKFWLKTNEQQVNRG